MDSKHGQTANLKQYRRIDGRWQFVPVGRSKDGKPDPRFVIIGGEPLIHQWNTYSAQLYTLMALNMSPLKP
jgi:hypothetical protein